MSTTTDRASISYFDHLPDELLEKIFFCFNDCPKCEPHNHVQSPPNTFYFDYSLQQPLLKENHANLVRLARVCRRFHQIIKSPHFWEHKCRREHLLQPDQHLPAQFTDYEKLYIYNPFHRAFNLIEESRWRKDGHSRVQIERCPIGTARLYDEFDRLSPCRATSHMSATYYQLHVPLIHPKLGSHQIAQLRPVIEFSICLSPRWDCGAQCHILLVFSDGHRWRVSRRFPQWSEQKWYRLTYRYANYCQLPSSVSLRIEGRDTQYWAGFFGIKFAQTRLRLLLRSNEDERNEASEMVIEPKPDDELLPPPQPNEFNDPTTTHHMDDNVERLFGEANDD